MLKRTPASQRVSMEETVQRRVAEKDELLASLHASRAATNEVLKDLGELNLQYAGLVDTETGSGSLQQKIMESVGAGTAEASRLSLSVSVRDLPAFDGKDKCSPVVAAFISRGDGVWSFVGKTEWMPNTSTGGFATLLDVQGSHEEALLFRLTVYDVDGTQIQDEDVIGSCEVGFDQLLSSAVHTLQLRNDDKDEMQRLVEQANAAVVLRVVSRATCDPADLDPVVAEATLLRSARVQLEVLGMLNGALRDAMNRRQAELSTLKSRFDVANESLEGENERLNATISELQVANLRSQHRCDDLAKEVRDASAGRKLLEMQIDELNATLEQLTQHATKVTDLHEGALAQIVDLEVETDVKDEHIATLEQELKSTVARARNSDAEAKRCRSTAETLAAELDETRAQLRERSVQAEVLEEEKQALERLVRGVRTSGGTLGNRYENTGFV